MKPHRVFPHGPIEELAPGVWRVRGGLSFPLYRNMIIVRLPSGELLIHSVVALDDNGMRALELLGRPAFAIIPNRYHYQDAGFYTARYPSLRMLTLAAIRDAIALKAPVDATVEEVLPRLGVGFHPVPATRSPEHVYDVAMPEGGRMLIINDILGNVGADAPGFIGRTFIRNVMVASGRPRVPRIYRWTQVKDLGAIKRFLAGLAATPDLRLVTVSHGEPIGDDPAGTLRAVASA